MSVSPAVDPSAVRRLQPAARALVGVGVGDPHARSLKQIRAPHVELEYVVATGGSAPAGDLRAGF